MLDIQTGVELDPERLLYDKATVALLEGLTEACLVAGDRVAYVQSHRFRDPDEDGDTDENDPRAAAFISVVGGRVAIQTVVGATVLSVKNLELDLTRIESEYPHIGNPLPIVHNEVVPPSHTLSLELYRDVEDGVNGIILMIHSLVGHLRIDVNCTPHGVVSHSSYPDEDGVVGESSRIENGKKILQNVVARMTVMFRLIAGGDVRLLTGGEEVRDEVEEMVQQCLREAGV